MYTGSNKVVAWMGEMTKERMGTASIPVDGSPPFERPTKNDPSAA
jgi:hypothetical protein